MILTIKDINFSSFSFEVYSIDFINRFLPDVIIEEYDSLFVESEYFMVSDVSNYIPTDKPYYIEIFNVHFDSDFSEYVKIGKYFLSRESIYITISNMFSIIIDGKGFIVSNGFRSFLVFVPSFEDNMFFTIYNYIFDKRYYDTGYIFNFAKQL